MPRPESLSDRTINVSLRDRAALYAPLIVNVNNSSVELTGQTLLDVFATMDRIMERSCGARSQTEAEHKAEKKRSKHNPDLDSLLPDRVDSILVVERNRI